MVLFKATMPAMKLTRRLLAACLILAIIVAAWLWWNRPRKTDMADLAPADAIVYLESNSLIDVAEAIANTDAWKTLSPYTGNSGGRWQGPWLRRFTAWTGLGPTTGVILARAQVAMVVLDLGAREQGETITIKPQAAVLIETHTSNGRITGTVEQYLRQFAEKAYGQPAFSRNNHDGNELLVWTAPASDRQIVAAIDGSLVIVGNSEAAVQRCLEVHRGQKPNLRGDLELQQVRSELAADGALAFGFVSSAHASQLVSLGAPLLFGKSPGRLNFDRIISSSAPKLIGAAGWTARGFAGGIEDRYLFSLQPTIASRLQPLFHPISTKSSPLPVLPEELQSLTIYKFEDPLATWQGVQRTLSSQLDTLSAILFTSLLKSSLLPYGIENPEEFLKYAGPDLITLRLKQNDQGALLIAQVRDEPALRRILSKTSRIGLPNDALPQNESNELQGIKTSVNFVNGYVLIGSDKDVLRGSQLLREQRMNAAPQLQTLAHFVPFTTSASVVTYTNDVERMRNFIQAIARAQGKTGAITASPEFRKDIENLPYAATETFVGEQGIDRRTKSALGQFSTLVPLLFPENKVGTQ